MLRAFLLAGASMLAATSAEAATYFYSTPGDYVWTAPSAGVYEVEVWGAQGGSSVDPRRPSYAGGLGAGVWTDLSLAAGQSLYVMVGEEGGAGTGPIGGGGGGGASAVLLDAALPYLGAIIAGGGGGAGTAGAGGAGQPLAAGGSGAAGLGYVAFGQGGSSGQGGRFGAFSSPGGGLITYQCGGCTTQGQGFYYGGGGGPGFDGGNVAGGVGGAGFAGGGGGGTGGGGGGGFSGGGGGGYGAGGPAGGGGGGSYLFDLSGPSGALGYEQGGGRVEILAVSGVPEPSEWLLMILGLAFTSHMLRRERWRRARAA